MTEHLVGQARLQEMLGLRVPPAFIVSTCGKGARRTIENPKSRREHYPIRYMPEDSVAGQLRFALRYEPLDMGVLAAAFRSIGDGPIADMVREEPNGSVARRAWFLYETLTGRRVDVPDAGTVTYVEALDTDLHVVADPVRSPRHKVFDNLLGTGEFCLTVRRTDRIISRQAQDLSKVAHDVVAETPPDILARANRYLMAKETKSSFEIEREKPSPQKAERFIHALENAPSFDPADMGSLIRLQNAIVDPRFAATGLRDFQNFVGETLGDHREKVHFICPRPNDIPDLVGSWAGMTKRLSSTDPVVAAALISSTFVFLHMFEDGNGRMSRFLVHSTLSSRGYTPEHAIFPVSAAILRDMRGYDEALESFSKPLFDYIEWRMTPQHEVEVLNDTGYLYRYFDATPQVEFLYDKVANTIETDLRDEITYIVKFDAALKAVNDIVDMPDRDAMLLARLMLQNGGTLSKKKRGDHFSKLTDGEIEAIETALAERLADEYESTVPGGP